MKMNKILMSLLSLALLFTVTACDNDDYDTNQLGKGVSLSVFGPNPVTRGGELRFIGTSLEKITKVDLPGAGSITNIKVVQSGSPSEIRITVPDEATEGFITLTASNGTVITTDSELTFTENIVFSSFSPTSVYPGDVLTIEGEYLEYIHEVLFSNSKGDAQVAVADSFFISHDRYTITLAVPEEASTGFVILSDGAEDIPNYIYSSEELIIGTSSVETVTSSSSFKAGGTITITGSHLDLVEYVRFYNADGEAIDVAEKGENKAVSTEYFFTYSDGVITVPQPAEAASGIVSLMMASGIEVVVIEEFVAVLPAPEALTDAVKNGAEIAITGNDLDLVTSIEFKNANGQSTYAEFEYANEAITLTVPDDAVDGEDNNMTLYAASGASVVVEGYELVKPTITSFATETEEPSTEVTAGDNVIINGTDLDLVVSVAIGGDAATPDYDSRTSESLTIMVPYNSVSQSAITLNLSNGTSIELESPKLTIQPAAFCYITSILPDKVSPGESFTVTVMNGDQLVGITIGDQKLTDESFSVEGDQLTITVPSTGLTTTPVSLVLCSGETGSCTVSLNISFEYSVVLSSHTDGSESWSFPVTMSWGSGGRFYIYKKNPIDLDDLVKIGAKLRFYVSSGTGQIQINTNGWTDIEYLTEWVESKEQVFEVELTQDYIDAYNMSGDIWLIIQGDALVVTDVTIQ